MTSSGLVRIDGDSRFVAASVELSAIDSDHWNIERIGLTDTSVCLFLDTVFKCYDRSSIEKQMR